MTDEEYREQEKLAKEAQEILDNRTFNAVFKRVRDKLVEDLITCDVMYAAAYKNKIYALDAVQAEIISQVNSLRIPALNKLKKPK